MKSLIKKTAIIFELLMNFKEFLKMKSAVIMIVMAIFSDNGKAQSQIFYRYSLLYDNEELDNCLNLYAHTILNDLQRNEYLDSYAKSRADYFLDVIQTNAEEGKVFLTMLDSISENHIAHHEVFGKPMYFNKPKTRYPDSNQINGTDGFVYNGEIMQELVVVWEEKNRIYSGESIALEARDKMENFYKMFLYRKILNSYKSSPPHNKTILIKGNGNYGTSIRILVSEKKVGRLWFYEAMVYNVVIFSKPIKKDD